MSKYFLEAVAENGYRLPKGKADGYDSIEEAIAAAEHHIDDYTVRVLKLVSAVRYVDDEVCNLCGKPLERHVHEACANEENAVSERD